MVLPGWTVARAIPYETLTGLLTGQYQLHGGVLRWAAGTANAGQIVRHLLPVNLSPLSVIPGLEFIPGIVANFQLEQLKGVTQFNTYQLMQLMGQVNTLSQNTETILKFAAGGALLSGLGLAVSTIGFTAMNNKLNAIDNQLKQIQQDVEAIKAFLESTERAKLFAALNDLLKIDLNTAREHRYTILHHARSTLAVINMRYRELLAEAASTTQTTTEVKTIQTVMAREEYFTITALAQVRCTAELGMLDMAHKEVHDLNDFWQKQAHQIVKHILVGKYPERFLATDFADTVSVADLAQWLDFVSEEKKGLDHIDQLRSQMDDRWYWQGMFSGGYSGLNKNVGIGLKKEKDLLIPALRKLIARSGVFEGYVAQYELLKSSNTKPSQLEQKLVNLPEASSVNGYFILQPSKWP